MSDCVLLQIKVKLWRVYYFVIWGFLPTPFCTGTLPIYRQFFWPLFKPYFLSTNKRQENEHSFVELFNRLSIGKATSEDISILSKRLLNLYPDVCTDNMLHIYQTLREVREFNEDIQKKVNPNVRTHECNTYFFSF